MNVKRLKNLLVSVLTIYLLTKSPKAIAQSSMKSMTDKIDLGKLHLTSEKANTESKTSEEYEEMINEIINFAELEIRTTSINAVKAITKELGGELAYEKKRADTYEEINRNLKIENDCLKFENRKKRLKAFLFGAGTSAITILAIKGFMTLGGN